MLQIEEGLWCLRQDFIDSSTSFNAYCNCFVVRMKDIGELMVISPISMTEEAVFLFSQIPGRVTNIVCNSVSPEHWVHTPGLLRRWPDATVWACPGIANTSGVVGMLPGGTDLWLNMLKDVKRSDGCAPNIRTIQKGPFPDRPDELGGDIEFAVFASDPPLLQEATVLIRSRRAVLLADLGFKQSDGLGLPAVMEFATAQLRVSGKLGAPISYPACQKNPELGRAWRDKVLGWEGWDRLLCNHLQPVVANGRQELAQCYAYLG